MDTWPLIGNILLIVILAAVALVVLSLGLSLSIAIIRAALKPRARRAEEPDGFLPPKRATQDDDLTAVVDALEDGDHIDISKGPRG